MSNVVVLNHYTCVPYLAHTKASAVPFSAQVLAPRCVQLGPQLFERDDVLPDLGKATHQFSVSHVQLDEFRCQLTATTARGNRHGCS